VMKLREIPFRKIEDGSKIIESRLFDEKRRQIKLGDIIEFCLEPELEYKVKAEVVALLNYPSFSELMTDVPAKSFGWEKAEQAIEEINQFYSAEDQAQWGVVGIKLKLI